MLYTLSQKIELTEQENSIVLRCTALLQKLFPAILSLPHIAHYIFWENSVPEITSEEQAFDIYANLAARNNQQKIQNLEENKENPIKIPLGAKLIHSLICLLFKENFTIAKLDSDDHKTLDPYGIDIKLIWTGGLQYAETKQSKNRKFDQNRCEILRVLLLCIGSQLYNPNPSVFNFFSFCCINGGAMYTKCLFFSLFNQILTYNWKGLGIPYASSKENYNDILTDLSIQIFCVLLEAKTPYDSEIESLLKNHNIFIAINKFQQENSKGMEIPIQKLAINEFKRILINLEGLPNFKVMFDGISKTLENYILVHNSALPKAIKEIKYIKEFTILLLWILQLNPVFYI